VGATLAVTGLTAAAIDVSDKLAAALPIYLLIVVGLALVLLLLIFRSIRGPGGRGRSGPCSPSRGLGAVVAVYQWGWLSAILRGGHTGTDHRFLPILMIGVLFGWRWTIRCSWCRHA